MAGDCCRFQLISGDGVLNMQGLENFTRTTNLSQRGLSYAVVAITGPQSGGKSTLMNQTFHTNFEEMDAYNGRGQTTKGIWIAKCSDIDPFTIAMDFEGTDSNQRGEDDTAFEKQSTLFALAIADVVLINMWYKDIGLEHAASRPLLKTVFQVMKRLFKPRKRTLLFVIRDHSKTPFEYLETALKEDIDEIWDSVAEPETSRSVVLSDFFNVEIAALCSYEFEEENFKEQVMVATVRCEEIAEEKLRQFTTDDDWLALKEDVQDGPVSGFGATLDSILETYLSQYDMEVIHFDQHVRNAKRRQMESQALEVVRNAYDTMLEYLYSNTLESFKTSLEQLLKGGEGFVASAGTCAQSCFLQFDKGCEDAFIRLSGWDGSGVRGKLSRHMLSEMMAKHVKQFTDVLADEVQSLFEAGEADTWVSVRNLLASKTDVAESELSNAHVDFEVPRSEIDKRLGYLKENARSVVERKARESAATRRVLMRMKDRFAKVFNHEENSKSGAWTSEQNIEEIERNALSASLKILEIMAAIRLDQTTDQIEHALFSSLMDGNGAVPASGATPDLLTSNAWEEVSPNATLLTPVECRSLWMQFKADIKYIINQATSAQGTLRQAKRAIKIVVGVAVVVGAAVVATVGAPTAMGIAARPEVAAVMKAVGPGLAAVMKDIGPEVLATLKDIGPEVAGAVTSLGPQIVTAVIAMMTNGFARPHQQ
ncbi:hypothetical protein D5086_023692 [Populus alba]|uniref:Uncharacterized protein n=1 Tax=Populus alba TaxID=43335 RepID=A0ACC4BB62_POPAL